MLSPRSASRLHRQVDLFSAKCGQLTAKCGQLKACRAQCESSAQEKLSQVKTELRSSEVANDLLTENLQTAMGRDQQQQSEIEDLRRQLDSAYTDQAELMHTQQLAYDTLRVELASCGTSRCLPEHNHTELWLCLRATRERCASADAAATGNS